MDTEIVAGALPNSLRNAAARDNVRVLQNQLLGNKDTGVGQFPVSWLYGNWELLTSADLSVSGKAQVYRPMSREIRSLDAA
jgi:hypothetical protein